MLLISFLIISCNPIFSGEYNGNLKDGPCNIMLNNPSLFFSEVSHTSLDNENKSVGITLDKNISEESFIYNKPKTHINFQELPEVIPEENNIYKLIEICEMYRQIERMQEKLLSLIHQTFPGSNVNASLINTGDNITPITLNFNQITQINSSNVNFQNPISTVNLNKCKVVNMQAGTMQTEIINANTITTSQIDSKVLNINVTTINAEDITTDEMHIYSGVPHTGDANEANQSQNNEANQSQNEEQKKK
jgi:predicted transcriptional regulator